MAREKREVQGVGGIQEMMMNVKTKRSLRCAPAVLIKSEVESAKRLWDAGTDTPWAIEPRNVALWELLRFPCKQAHSHFTNKDERGVEGDVTYTFSLHSKCARGGDTGKLSQEVKVVVGGGVQGLRRAHVLVTVVTHPVCVRHV